MLLIINFVAVNSVNNEKYKCFSEIIIESNDLRLGERERDVTACEVERENQNQIKQLSHDMHNCKEESHLQGYQSHEAEFSFCMCPCLSNTAIFSINGCKLIGA